MQLTPRRLWEPGYRDRYYEQKFSKLPSDTDFRKHVGHSYVEGLAWVLLYYYQVCCITPLRYSNVNFSKPKGCPSWNWYYPYHYAPFAQDVEDISNIKISFQLGKPFKPWEQLMAVLPAARCLIWYKNSRAF